MEDIKYIENAGCLDKNKQIILSNMVRNNIHNEKYYIADYIMKYTRNVITSELAKLILKYKDITLFVYVKNYGTNDHPFENFNYLSRLLFINGHINIKFIKHLIYIKGIELFYLEITEGVIKSNNIDYIKYIINIAGYTLDSIFTCKAIHHHGISDSFDYISELSKEMLRWIVTTCKDSNPIKIDIIEYIEYLSCPKKYNVIKAKYYNVHTNIDNRIEVNGKIYSLLKHIDAKYIMGNDIYKIGKAYDDIMIKCVK